MSNQTTNPTRSYSLISPSAPTVDAPRSAHAAYYTTRGFGIVEVPPASKGPRRRAWQNNPITDPAKAERHWTLNPHDNMGILLGQTKSSLDIDNIDLAEKALEAVGIDLLALLYDAAISKTVESAAVVCFTCGDFPIA